MPAQSVLFSLGFRPFFLCAGGYGALALAAWLGWLSEVWELPQAYPAAQLHAHEMLFGFALAAVAGFLTTAVPQWTARPPLRGIGLAVLVGTWLLGRLAMLGAGFVGPIAAMLLDLVFPAALCAVIAAMLLSAQNRRNYGFIYLLAGAAVANLCWHLEMTSLFDGFDDVSTAELAMQLMLNLLTILVAIVGGRVIPMFSANWLRRQGQELAPRQPAWLMRLCIILLVGLSLIELFAPWLDGRVIGLLAVITGLAYLYRLVGWNGYKTLAHPLVWILHLAYLWLCLSLLLKGGHYLSDAVPLAAARHAAAVGAVGTMIMAIMPRVSLGHTGRELLLPKAMLFAYVVFLFAPVLRVASPFLEGAGYQISLLASGLCWSVAFAIYLVGFAPMLLAPRADGR